MPGGYVWEAKRQSIFCTRLMVITRCSALAEAARLGVLVSHSMSIHVQMCMCSGMFPAAALDDCIFGWFSPPPFLPFFFPSFHSLFFPSCLSCWAQRGWRWSPLYSSKGRPLSTPSSPCHLTGLATYQVRQPHSNQIISVVTQTPLVLMLWHSQNTRNDFTLIKERYWLKVFLSQG